MCHMLKVVRNTLADGGILVDLNGEHIRWQYIVELHKLQACEHLRLGNKLKLTHIEWRQQKMKVNLAAQVFSSSVTDALQYCSHVLKLPQVSGCNATVKSIHTFDRLFDILNSRNPFAKGFKSALRVSNKLSWHPFLDTAHSYILELKDTPGNYMLSSKRKTGFIGFLIATRSIQGIFNDWVERESSPLKYLLTYKLSQDHLELFFCAVRSAGGFNNNPTTKQFTAAYKRVLLCSTIQVGNGNCVSRNPTDILHILKDSYQGSESAVSISHAATIRKDNLLDSRPVKSDHDYTDIPMV